MNKILLILVIVVFALMTGSYFYLGLQEREPKTWLVDEDEILGSAIMANGLNYTLNYSQQQDVLDRLKHSKKVKKTKFFPSSPSGIERILIYLADQKDPFELIPASNDFSFFTVKAWKKPDYLEINEPEDLENTLEQAYDK